jgi:soluble lytic murein transglycosylase
MLSAPIAIRYLVTGLAAVGVLAICMGRAESAEIDEQRELFTRTHTQVERGDWSVVDDLTIDEQRLLSDYVLWPDLRAAFFRATLPTADAVAVQSFLAHYGALRPARDLRYQYALQLARVGDLAGFFEIYQQFYQGQDLARLDCLALRAELAADREQRIVNRALDLWMTGESQAKECDPVFAYLQDKNLLGRTEYIRRFELAVEAREFTRARWLAKSIDATYLDNANRWLAARNSPAAFVRDHRHAALDPALEKQIVYAIERVTFVDPTIAADLWSSLQAQHRFPSDLALSTARHIALWTARDRLPGAHGALTALADAAQDDEVLRWRARTSLRERDWSRLLDDLASMSAAEANAEEWRYWRGIALQRSGRAVAAAELLAGLAGERSYYGFLAADELAQDYALGDRALDADETAITELAKRPDLIRARELFLVGQDSRGRSEWNAAMASLTPAEKAQAAQLANRWGWHSRAIAAAASAGEYDDLALRYPLPYRQSFAEHAKSASIRPTWAYSIARSESLFMRDVRSGAGAVGLMQLMPATGRQVARQLHLPYSGLDTLTNPQDNIRLGTSYLGQMAARFGGNRVLATAAYNAGPHRVDQWLPDSGDVDARIWIETIPFNETRKYVRRVMAAETIFHWRMTGQTRRMSEALARVSATPATQQLARN